MNDTTYGYRISFTDSRFYLGISKNPEHRWRQHLGTSESKPGKLLIEWFFSHPDKEAVIDLEKQYQREILGTFPTRDDALFWERICHLNLLEPELCMSSCSGKKAKYGSDESLTMLAEVKPAQNHIKNFDGWDEERRKARVGKVSIDTHNNSYRLRFTYPKGKRNDFRVYDDWNEALEVANIVNKDIKANNVDFTYARYSSKYTHRQLEAV